MERESNQISSSCVLLSFCFMSLVQLDWVHAHGTRIYMCVYIYVYICVFIQALYNLLPRAFWNLLASMSARPIEVNQQSRCSIERKVFDSFAATKSNVLLRLLLKLYAPKNRQTTLRQFFLYDLPSSYLLLPIHRRLSSWEDKDVALTR